jgi:hypothetical protein
MSFSTMRKSFPGVTAGQLQSAMLEADALAGEASA